LSDGRQEGGCRCGEVRFAVNGDPLITFACHCNGCQRMTASAFSLSSLYPADRFERTQGDTMIGGLKGATKHHFCPSCMSWLFTEPDGMSDFVNVRSTTLDDPAGHRPFVDVYLGEGLAWAASGAQRPYDSMPNDGEFGALTAAYAQWDEKGST
jgi:hypothetical protein